MTRRCAANCGAAIGIALAMVVVPGASADLLGTTFNMVSEYTDSPFLPGGSWNDLGAFEVGAGMEWSSGPENVYDYEGSGDVVGTIQFDLDIGADYIELTSTWTNWEIDDAWTFLTLSPGEFYGYHLTWDSPVDIVSAALSVSGNPVHTGDLNLYDGALEDWVDGHNVDPQSDDRITISQYGLDLNMQGIAWEYYQAGDQSYSETARIELTFVPAPGAIVLLGIAGLRRRRRA